MTGAAAVGNNGRLDVVATNALARGVQADVFDTEQPPNLARYCFLDARSHHFYDDWPSIADVTVAILRTEAGRDPHDRALTDLVGELATRSEEFRVRWARHDVCTSRGPSCPTTPSSETSRWTTTPSRYRPTMACPWPATPPSPAARPQRGSCCSPAGPPPLNRQHSTTQSRTPARPDTDIGSHDPRRRAAPIRCRRDVADASVPG
jgi:hypothetical protein